MSSSEEKKHLKLHGQLSILKVGDIEMSLSKDLKLHGQLSIESGNVYIWEIRRQGETQIGVNQTPEIFFNLDFSGRHFFLASIQTFLRDFGLQHHMSCYIAVFLQYGSDQRFNLNLNFFAGLCPQIIMHPTIGIHCIISPIWYDQRFRSIQTFLGD